VAAEEVDGQGDGQESADEGEGPADGAALIGGNVIGQNQGDSGSDHGTGAGDHSELRDCDVVVGHDWASIDGLSLFDYWRGMGGGQGGQKRHEGTEARRHGGGRRGEARLGERAIGGRFQAGGRRVINCHCEGATSSILVALVPGVPKSASPCGAAVAKAALLCGGQAFDNFRGRTKA